MKSDSLSGTRAVRLSGFGGQGVVLMGHVLAEALAGKFEYVSSSASYGPESRGSACRADVLFSNSFISYPKAENVDFLVALSQGAYDKFSDSLKKDATVIYDSELVTPKKDRGFTLFGTPATKLAAQKFANPKNANFVMLGALVSVGKFTTKNALGATLKKLGFPEGPSAVAIGWCSAKKE